MKKSITAGIIFLIIVTGMMTESSVIGHEKIIQYNKEIQAIATSKNTSRSFNWTENISQKGPLLKVRGIITAVSDQDVIVGGIGYSVRVNEILEGEHPWIIGEEVGVGILFHDCVGSYDFYHVGDTVEVYGEYWGMKSGQTV
jgi:hypothetical protein